MKTQQSGFAHAVLIIGLVVALIGALGFIFWQNFIHKDPAATQTVRSDENKNGTMSDQKGGTTTNKVYSNDAVAFEYPSSGWKQKEQGFDDELARIETDDFIPSVGMGIEKGAELSVHTTSSGKVPQVPGVEDVTEIIVDGNKAFKYSTEYEGYRTHAVFTSNEGKSYGVTMTTSAKATSTEKAAFELVLKTLDIN